MTDRQNEKQLRRSIFSRKYTIHPAKVSKNIVIPIKLITMTGSNGSSLTSVTSLKNHFSNQAQIPIPTRNMAISQKRTLNPNNKYFEQQSTCAGII